jgi:putative membrane protein
VVTDESTGPNSDEAFWSEMFALRGSVTPYVIRRVMVFGGLSLFIYVLNELIHPNLGIDLGPYEVAGAVLGLLLVFRTNAGYDRWYEGRKLFGQILNDSRNLAITALTYGPEDPAWRESVVRWIAAFGHSARASLRGEQVPPEVRALLGEQWAAEVRRAENMPMFVAFRIGEFMRLACDEMGMDPLGFRQASQERLQLIDHYGACEKILKTPIPRAYAVNIRRIIFLYLAATPFALLDRIGWLTPLATMLVAYPILALDQLGVELQSPFATKSLNHLPLDDITRGIETDLLALLAQSQTEQPPIVKAAPPDRA